MTCDLYFNKSYLSVLDSLLDYSGPCNKADFLALLHRIESSMRFHPNHNKGTFENHKIRLLFGKVRIPYDIDPISERIKDFFNGETSLGSSTCSNHSFSTYSSLSTGSDHSLFNTKTPNINILQTTTRPYGGTRSPNVLKKRRVWKLDLLIKQLKETGVLTVSDYSYKNKKTREYSYGPYFNMLLDGKKTELIKSKVNFEYYKNIKKEIMFISSQAKAQYDLLVSDRFTIDDKKAMEWINDNYIKGELSGNQRIACERMVFDMKDKNIFSSIGPKSNRITTSFTSIKRELRQFCKIDGKTLESVDLKSSQPYILATYFLKNNRAESLSFYNDVVYNDIYTIFLDHARKEGLTKFKVWNKSYMEDKELCNRDDTKIEFLRMLFKQSGKKPILENIMEKYYPEFNKVFKKYKKDLAPKLQKEESFIFIPVCDEFISEGCLSVHDSLYFKPEIKDRVLNKLNDRLNSLGYKDYVLK